MKGWEYAQVEAVKAAAQGDETTSKALAKLSIEMQSQDRCAELNAYSLSVIMSPVLNIMGLLVQVVVDVFCSSIGKQALRDHVKNDVQTILDIASENATKMVRQESNDAN